MAYLGEFRTNWRALAASTLGIAAGYGINNYLNNLFIPALMAEFGWSSASVALLGTAAALSIVCQPLAGRLTDRVGVRRVAIFGVACSALFYVALSFMSGSFMLFFLLNAAQIALVAATTGPVVYSRLIAQTYVRARGVALSIAMSAPSIAAVAVVPLLSTFIDEQGWRSGYRVAAVGALLVGGLGILLAPALTRRSSPAAAAGGTAGAGMRELLGSPPFRLIIAGTILCSLTIVMQTTQMKVILLDAGLSSAGAASIISIYAIGVIAGRLLSGVALDHLPAHVVATVAMGLPAIGLLILATGVAHPFALAVAVLFLGFSLGAEGDIGGFLTMRYFRVDIYSTVMGFVIGSIAVSSALGSLLLSAVIALTGSFAPFLVFAALSAIVGSSLFWRLRRIPAVSLAPDAAN